ASATGQFTTTTLVNLAPTAPTTPYSDNTTAQSGRTNPNDITDTSPAFSAIYEDPDPEDNANKYRVEVNTASNFTGTVMWDSGSSGTSMADTTAGTRSPDIIYAGSPLADSTTYYWRITFWDDDGAEGAVSATQQFTTTTLVNAAPTAPTTPYSNNDTAQSGQTNPTDITDLTPAFSAIYEDPNPGDIANKYRVEVNTQSDFLGTVMWDVGASGNTMANTIAGNRCPDIIYAGAPLQDATTYYWRITFWDDDGAEGAVSATQQFTTTTLVGTPTNYRSIGTNSGILYNTGNASIDDGTTTVTFGNGASLPVPTAVGAVGQGDKLVLDPGGLNEEVFYILSRDGDTHVTVQTAATLPHTNESYEITRAYNDFQTWESGQEGNLVTADKIEVGVAYKDGVFMPTGVTTINDSTTDASHYMQLTVAPGQRHNGTAGTGVIVDGGSMITGHIFHVRDPYFKMEWLEIRNFWGTVSSGAISLTFVAPNRITRASGSFITDGFVIGNTITTDSAITANQGPFTVTNVTALEITVSETVVVNEGPVTKTVTKTGGQPINVDEGEAAEASFSHLLIHDYTSTARGAINIYENATVRNSIFYNGDVGIRTYSNTLLTLTLENVTIYGMTGDGVFHRAGTLVAKNTISVGNGGQDFDVDNTPDGVVDQVNSGYNLYSTVHGTVHPGTNNQSPPASLEDLFISIAATSEDLHLEPSGHDALNNGTDLSASFTDDIDTETRPTGANTWDIGADEYIPPLTSLYRSVGITATALASGANFPSVQTTNTSATTTASTSHTVNLPAGIQSGDLIIALFSGYIGSGTTPVDVSWPLGWTEFFEQDASTSTLHLAVAGAYRKADGTEGASITVTTNLVVLAAHNTYRISGAADPATQPPQAAAISYTDTANGIDPPVNTPTGGAKDYLWLAVAGWRRTGIGMTTDPANYTDAIEATSSGGSIGTRLRSLRRQLNASSEDPSTFTLGGNSERRIGVTIAVHPSVATANGLTISGSTATFGTALADNIGVGDVIQYDSDDNGSIDALAFIHG
ncbi:MAG: hypothetical protein GTO14_11555, partial [Anaerolineales bacterium]|nr:hypothetical protein [Anaerolineales bacterium]